ncbi:hypothetical protein P3T76_002574 [Phytophthora citrophthora]|uniref:Uncharacterized protein n=1 Tax=Phytophthora citrophthora TaxID=4793 RepID=A0AAD9GWU8_9STRA|nr:hypothetical protein P3T76_002574 [Phytophthora citrophthora]
MGGVDASRALTCRDLTDLGQSHLDHHRRHVSPPVRTNFQLGIKEADGNDYALTPALCGGVPTLVTEQALVQSLQG